MTGLDLFLVISLLIVLLLLIYFVNFGMEQYRARESQRDAAVNWRRTALFWQQEVEKREELQKRAWSNQDTQIVLSVPQDRPHCYAEFV